MKRRGYLKKNAICERLACFQVYRCTFSTNEFENNDNIYSDELKLKKDEDLCKALFLDLSIEVQDRILTTGCLTKEMLFPFISTACPI